MTDVSIKYLTQEQSGAKTNFIAGIGTWVIEVQSEHACTRLIVPITTTKRQTYSPIPVALIGVRAERKP